MIPLPSTLEPGAPGASLPVDGGRRAVADRDRKVAALIEAPEPRRRALLGSSPRVTDRESPM